LLREPEQDLCDLARRRQHRVVTRLELVVLPLAILAQALGELIEGAHGGAGAVDVGALEPLATHGGQRLLERLERLRHEPALQPVAIALAGGTATLPRERGDAPAAPAPPPPPPGRAPPRP